MGFADKAGPAVARGGAGDGVLDPATIVVHAGRPPAVAGAPVNEPISVSSVYRSTGHEGGAMDPDRGIYARVHNPTWAAFEEALGALEGGAARSFASGMAAIAAVLDGVPDGGVMVAPWDAYTGSRFQFDDLAARGRAEVRLVDVSDTAATLEACDGADLLWVESPTNPLLAVADLRALVDGAHRQGTRVVVDNTFATPLLQRPLDLGADVVVHSATKYLAGHSDVLMGAAVTRDEALAAALADRRTLTGAIPGPFEAWVVLRGVRTLAVRLERAQATAGELALRLVEHPAVTRVRYPGLAGDPWHARAAAQMAGFGAIVSFEMADAEVAQAACEATRLIVHTTSLGGVETTMERRAVHAGEVAPDSLVRISVGLEAVDDLWADLDRALHARGTSGGRPGDAQGSPAGGLSR